MKLCLLLFMYFFVVVVVVIIIIIIIIPHTAAESYCYKCSLSQLYDKIDHIKLILDLKLKNRKKKEAHQMNNIQEATRSNICFYIFRIPRNILHTWTLCVKWRRIFSDTRLINTLNDTPVHWNISLNVVCFCLVDAQICQCCVAKA